jgi:hypothetical protein
MGYEIDFLPVGNGEKSGDAIAFRFGNLSGSRDEQFVAVVDGGIEQNVPGQLSHRVPNFEGRTGFQEHVDFGSPGADDHHAHLLGALVDYR